MTIKTVLKYMAVVGAVAIAAPSAYAAEMYTTIGGDDEGPIFPVYGGTMEPVISGETYTSAYTEAPTYTAIKAPVGAPGPDDGYTNIGTDSGGPVFDLHAGAQPEYGPAEEVDILYSQSVSTVTPMGYAAPSTYYEPAAYMGPSTYSEPPAYYVPARDESGSPLIPVYR